MTSFWASFKTWFNVSILRFQEWFGVSHFQIDLSYRYCGIFELATVLATFQKMGEIFQSSGHPAWN
jgi:hypothetical protein